MKNSQFIAAFIATATLITSTPVAVFAAPKNPKPFELPANAVQVLDNVFYLGSASDPTTGATVDGYAIVHRKNNKAKPSGGKGGPGSCYAFLASGAKWKGIEPWLMNGINNESIDATTAFNLMAAGVNKWEDAADGVVGNSAGVDVFGTGTLTTDILSSETTAPDEQNEAYFGTIAEANVIAVTTVWGVFGGPTRNRKLVEWDMIIDQETFDWSITGEAGKMDFDNIVTHELGHAFGMDHPAGTCTQETMYAYAENGEIIKRDLGAGDIAGINALY